MRLGLRVIEPVRQWGNVRPNGTEGDGLLVSRAWRSRVLGMELVRNKVVPSKPRKRKTGLLGLTVPLGGGGGVTLPKHTSQQT